jgi:rubrerythrin
MKSDAIQSPLDDLTYDVLAVLQKKAEGLEAYAKYLRDAEGEDDIAELFEEMRNQDVEHIDALKDVLARRLEEDSDYEEDEEEGADDADVEPVDEPPNRGESTTRR